MCVFRAFGGIELVFKMTLKSILTGGAAASLLLLGTTSCGDSLKDNSESLSGAVKVSFAVAEASVPVNGTQTLEIDVTPAGRADEVIVTVSDDSVVGIESTEYTEKGAVLTLKALKLSSTTIYAIHEDLEAPAECAVTVTPIGVESVSLDKTSVDLVVGGTFSFSPTVNPSDATSPLLTWKSDNEEIATVDNGKVTAVKEGTATITVSCQGKEATCTVTVSAIRATSLKLAVDGQQIQEKTISTNEKFKLDAEILPENVSYKTVEWSVSDEATVVCDPIVIGGESVSAYVTALKAGTATVTAKTTGDNGAELTASLKVNVQQSARPSTEPKIGDYFYSDGTWSDGGLISINADGTEAQWLTGLEKPAPDPDKTVIGIIFQTASDRFSSSETAAGYTHGLVFSLKSAHGSKSMYTRYAFDDATIDFLGSCYYASAWYSDIDGYSLNQKVLAQFADNTDQVPAFDFVHTDFSPAAPSNTSGWFIPSIGQLWDFVANLGGTAVAGVLSSFRDYDADVTWYKEDKSNYQYGQITVGENVAEILNAHWAKVPESQRDDLVFHNESSLGNTCWLLSSTPYVSGETCCVIELGDNKCIYLTGEYFSNVFCCHPILAF